MTEYNGHPSYEHWNASLWFNNDESLYQMALEYDDPGALYETIEELFNMKGENPYTPDGVELTPELVQYAWQTVRL